MHDATTSRSHSHGLSVLEDAATSENWALTERLGACGTKAKTGNRR